MHFQKFEGDTLELLQLAIKGTTNGDYLTKVQASVLMTIITFQIRS